MPLLVQRALPRPLFLWPAVCLAAVLIVVGLFNTPDPLAFKDTDEAMRLVQLRAFMAGQGWFDLVPHRLDPSFDRPMHWSRFVDLSLAAVYQPLAWLMPPPDAERLMAIVWPALMMIVCAVPLAMIARQLGGPSAAFIAVLLLAGVKTIVEFMPGRIDHHSVQMAACLFAIAAAMGRAQRGMAALAGFATAFALALGIETIPYLVILAAFFAADFVRGQRLANVRAYALTLLASALVLFCLTTAPRFYFYTACDGLTVNVLAAVGSGAAMLVAATLWSDHRESTSTQRLFLIMLIGCLAAVASLSLEPRCVRGVIGTFDPAIRPLWFDHIEEIASLPKMLKHRPEIALPALVFPALAGAVFLWQIRTVRARDDMQILAACFAAACLVMAWQIRGAFYANMFALPCVAMALAAMHQRISWLRALRTGPLLTALALVGLTYLTAYATHSLAKPIDNRAQAAATAASKDRSGSDAQCLAPASLKALADLPPGLVLAPIDMGSFIMLETPHSVISAPYHRFDRGIALGQSILYRMDLPNADAAMRQRGVDYVAFCRDGTQPLLEQRFLETKREGLQEISAPGSELVILKLIPSSAGAKAPKT